MGFYWECLGWRTDVTLSQSAPLDVIPTIFFQLFSPDAGQLGTLSGEQ